MKHLTIASEWINAILASFASLGLERRRVTAGIGGFVDGRSQPNQRLDLNDVRRLWHRADQLAGDPLLGCRVSPLQDYRSIGVLAPVLWHSPTVGDLLHNIIRYQCLISDGGVFSLREYEHQGQACIDFAYVPAPGALAANPQQVLSVVSGSLALLPQLLQQPLDAGSASLALGLPEGMDAAAIGSYLHIETYLSERWQTISWRGVDLHAPLPGTDHYLYDINRSYAERLLSGKREGEALIDTIKQQIVVQGYRRATLAGLQAELQLHPRALQRYLAEQGTSFRLLKEEVLKAAAVAGLAAGQAPELLAGQLGYSELSAFYRAFKGWFGVPPLQFDGTGV